MPTEEDCSIADLAPCLSEQGIPTRKGKTVWDRSTVWGMLRNPAYRGQAAYTTTKVADRHRPDMPEPDSATSSLNPSRPSLLAPERPVSSFTTATAPAGQSQPDRPLTQRVLPRRGLPVALHLPGRGLADIHDRPSPPVPPR